MVLSHTTYQNRILAALSTAAYNSLLPDLEFISILAGEEIHPPGIRITSLYFPVDCIVVSIGELASGDAFLTSLTGNEGMVGISYLLGCENACERAVALTGGGALRIRAALLKKEFDSGKELQRPLLRFTRALKVQMTHIALGARHYSIEQQLCLFLLIVLDRMPDNELRITHEQVSIFLGVRRESITLVAQKLEMTGAINYRRGHLTVVDREELEARVKGSYAVVSKEYLST